MNDEEAIYTIFKNLPTSRCSIRNAIPLTTINYYYLRNLFDINEYTV